MFSSIPVFYPLFHEWLRGIQCVNTGQCMEVQQIRVTVKALPPLNDGRSRPKYANAWSVYTRIVSTVSEWQRNATANNRFPGAVSKSWHPMINGSATALILQNYCACSNRSPHCLKQEQQARDPLASHATVHCGLQI
jgi:hypothetical protein